MARRQLRQFRSSGSRPNRGWGGTVATTNVNVPAASKVLLGTVALDNNFIDETFLRSIGGIKISSDQVSTNELQIGAFGVALVSETAAALGITAVPDPVTDADDDIWFVYQSFAQQFQFLDATGASLAGNFGAWYPIDSKAKRVVHGGMIGAIVVANSHVTHAFDIMFNLRVLSQVRGTR